MKKTLEEIVTILDEFSEDANQWPFESAKRRNLRRKFSVKKKVKAQKGKLRLCISRSNKNFYAQVIDDAAGTTLVGLSTMGGEFKDDSNRSNSDSAVKLGKLFAEKAIEKGITMLAEGLPF